MQRLQDTFVPPGRVCCLHGNSLNAPKKSITLFKVDTLAKCRLILQFRKENNLKYHSTVLPDAVDNTHGYHRECYQRFNALSPTYVQDDFSKGLFAIQRTTKLFSSNAIDLTLEQTINASSASQRHGTLSMSNSISARQRWAESNYLRSIIMMRLLEELGMGKQENVSKELTELNIHKNNIKVREVKRIITEMNNPFSVQSDKDFLFNIATGKAASEAAENFLLSFKELGDKRREEFIDECIKDPMRFSKTIRKTKIATFATDAGGKKFSYASSKYKEACLTRDVFGSLLCQALRSSINIEHALTYPLTQFLLSLCHADGTMQKTTKSTFMKHLESKVKSTSPQHVDISIIDASFLLHLHQNPPCKTFGAFAEYFLKIVMNFNRKIVHFVTDKWIQPSIKDSERDMRQGTAIQYVINGPGQMCPFNWIASLRNHHFKTALVKFLIDHWRDSSLADIFGEKILFANAGDYCYKFYVQDGVVVKEEAVDYFCTHEEADSRMFFHLHKSRPRNNFVIRTSDTDCLVIGLASHHIFSLFKNVWLDVGTDGNNSRRFINLNELSTTLGKNLCQALPLFHALTGSDYTSSFCRKGKVKPFKLLERDLDLQVVFGALATDTDISPNSINAIERFVCHIYGKKHLMTTDDARYCIFVDKYKPKLGDKRLSITKSLDGSLLPPCSKVLNLKIKRAHLVARRWCASVYQRPPCDIPEQCGWTLQNNAYKILWYQGEAVPLLLDLQTEDCNDLEIIQELGSNDEFEEDSEESACDTDDE